MLTLYYKSKHHCFRTAPTHRPIIPPVSPSGGGNKFPRGQPSRNTFHGGPVQRRINPGQAYNGPGGMSLTSQDTSAMGGNRMSFINKLTSKFSRRLVVAWDHNILILLYINENGLITRGWINLQISFLVNELLLWSVIFLQKSILIIVLHA